MFRRNKAEAQSAKSSIKPKANEKGSHFKIVTRCDSALLPNQGHSGGWINRTQEHEDAAHSVCVSQRTFSCSTSVSVRPGSVSLSPRGSPLVPTP